MQDDEQLPTEQQVEGQEPTETVEDTESQKKKILLVEDDIALAAVYRSRLELEDF